MGLNRVRQPHLDIYSGYTKKFSQPQGVAAVKLSFNDQEGGGDDDELTVYGVNSGTGEIFYNKSMVSLGFFGQQDQGQHVLIEAVGIDADEKGEVFVADRGSHKIVHLRISESNELGYVDSFDLSGSAQPLRTPTDVAVENESIFITDTGNDRIIEVDLQGNLVREINGKTGLHMPWGIDVIMSRDWNFFGSRFMVVTDSLNQRISLLSLDGEVIESVRYGEISDAPGGFFFVAVDYYSNIYVTDHAGGCIYKFDRFLRFLTRVGCGSGTGDDLVEPRGISVYRRFGQIFVAEKNGASYFWVGTDVENLRSSARDERGRLDIRVRFLLTEHSWVTIRLETDGGKPVKTFAKKSFMNAGHITLQYRLSTGEVPCPIANCKYRVTVHAQPTYSSREFHSVERTGPLRDF
ncbi:MAG: NHL repeat-containing protein [Candidatus Krumholzibacteria bacterium]|nr:NHL repeat-containing protein [Candidatus Krumholzibacteria bacterium]